MRKDPAIKIAYIAKYASIANGWKKWQGEVLGLKTYKVADKKAQYEAEFTKRIEQDAGFKYKYNNLLPRLRQLYKDIEPYAFARDYFMESFVRNTELLPLASSLSTLADVFDKSGEAGFVTKRNEAMPGLTGFFKDFKPEVDEAVLGGTMELFAKNMKPEWGGSFVNAEAQKHGGFPGLAAHLFKNSSLSSLDRLKAMLEDSPAKAVQAIRNDPLVVFWKSLNDNYQSNVQPKIQELQPQINLLQRQYMAAQMEVFKEKRFFPDANSTLRLTYGKVRGYSPRDAVQYEYQTDLDGVMEKYVPGDYEFDVPQKLIDLWKSKDYGQYSTADGRLPVAFIGVNHTTGGNSGSPALDARGNLVGLNFDRVWEGTMSDLNYEPAICRNIMVDTRYILFIIDKYGGAGYLLQEMKLVKGKKKKKK
jgi:hypothetical protein